MIDEARVERALSQTFQLLYFSGKEEVEILLEGTSGTVYQLCFREECRPTCSCPDYAKYCKHILYILLGILGNTRFDRKKLDGAHMRLLRRNLKLNIRQRAEDEVPLRETEECGICLEPNESDLVHCRYGCGRQMHRACLEQWVKINATCIYCRKRIKC